MDSNMRNGDKAASGSLFRKPDWVLAASYYEKAAISFKIAKSHDQTVKAYEKLSDAHFKSDAIHLAGKALEDKAFILAQYMNKPQAAADAYQQASNYFMTQGSIDRAVSQLEKAGRALENVDVNASYGMYSKACLLYEQEDRGRFAVEIFKKAISLLIRNKKYDKAIDMLKRESVILRKLTSKSELYKANLSILILLFTIGDDVEAGKQFSQMCGNSDGFAQSEEAEIAENLLRAYDERDQELLEKTLKLQHITFLDNEVAKLVRFLRVPGEVLSSTGPNRHENNSNSNNIRPPSQFKGVAADNNVLGMSHAQARLELYSRSGPPASAPATAEDLNKGFSNMRVQDDDDDEEGLR